MSDVSRRGFLIASAGVGLTALSPMSSAQAASDTIAISYQEQKEQNWCSAAAARIALSATDRRPSQAALAKDLGLGPIGGHGLLDVQHDMPPVLNRRLGQVGQRFRYRFFNDMNRFDEYVKFGCNQDKPIVYNVLRVADQPYGESGHYICITGRRATNGRIQYRIADPDSPARTGNWYNRSEVQSWNKYDRYVAWS